MPLIRVLLGFGLGIFIYEDINKFGWILSSFGPPGASTGDDSKLYGILMWIGSERVSVFML